MKILFDHQAFDFQTHGGVSRCFAELISNMPKEVETSVSILETDNVYMQQLGFPAKGTTYAQFLPWLKFEGLKKILFKIAYNIKLGHYSSWDKKPLLNEYTTEIALKNGDYDIFHPTFFFDDFLKWLPKNKPFVLTVHDMIPELYPQYFDANNLQIQLHHSLIPKADHIIAVSEQTKLDTMRLFDIPSERISVIYHGADEKPYIPTKGFSMESPYILYVGARDIYKNFRKFVVAAKSSMDKHPELAIVCTGKPFTEDEKQFIEEQELTGRIKQLFARDDQHLSDLYHHAEAFVYPSDYEGFGIPILEAWRADCPVMLRDETKVFHEVAEDGATYFKLNDEDSDFSTHFEEIYAYTQKEKSDLLARQRQRLAQFSWKKSAQQLCDVYKLVTQTNK